MVDFSPEMVPDQVSFFLHGGSIECTDGLVHWLKKNCSDFLQSVELVFLGDLI